MEIKIKKLNDITVIFIVGDEDKVEVKYFKKEDEITSWDEFTRKRKKDYRYFMRYFLQRKSRVN